MKDAMEKEQKESPWSADSVAPVVQQLVAIRHEMLELESKSNTSIHQIPAERRSSARNLLHYMALRSRDIRDLQEELVSRGLSSLGRCEANVMSNVEAVIGVLCEMTNSVATRLSEELIPVDFDAGRELLQRNAKRLFGEGDDSKLPIMVTMTSQAAEDYAWVRDLLASGMGVMRINCAHDDQRAWGMMIENLRRAEAEVGRSCRVAMDLSGPKIRTGPIEPGPRVFSWRPKRDEFGRVVTPARIWISPLATDQPPADFDFAIAVTEDWWKSVTTGDTLTLSDAAGRTRELKVVATNEDGLSVEASETAYVTPETLVRRQCLENKGNDRNLSTEGHFGPIQPVESWILLHQGDELTITDSLTPGCSAKYDTRGQLISPARIGCTLSEIFRDARKGERVLLDDGKVEGVVEELFATHLVMKIRRAREKGQRLRADKGVNVPDTNLQLPALTAKDIEDLEFIAHHADIVSYSFVRRPDDIRLLHDQLVRLGKPNFPIILKIENRQAFDNLPLLLLEVMRDCPTAGVMIARGDLAVECGWERLVEVQEEILWVCESAHIPVVWATQVLEGLAKKGLPTRAEVTDAGMGARAECVMLNNGPNILETVQTLHRILHKMKEHQVKKRATFRRLNMAERLLSC